jgi:stage II sporulation SpoAA-like protein
LLVILENFEGWECGADWNDLDFTISHGGKISKIAIVAEPRWETPALAFAGAGSRRTPVKFFRLTNSSRREAGWRNRRTGSGGHGEPDCAISACDSRDDVGLRLRTGFAGEKVPSRSRDAVIHVYDEAGNVMETHEHAGEFREF